MSFVSMSKINLSNQIQEHGYLVIENIFSHKEISKLRRIVKNHFSNKGVAANSGLTQPNAAVEIPEISWLYHHPKILILIGELLGQEKIMFTSHCDVHSGTLSSWHKDDGMTVMDGGYFGNPTYDKLDCCVYKVAIYLQDHVRNRGGLTVRKGSHRFSSLDQGEEVYLKIRAGDVVIFDVRLNHTGQREAVPLPTFQKPLKLIKKIVNKLWKIEPQRVDNFFRKIYNQISGERLSIFFTYGVTNEHTKNFAVNNMKRQILQNNSNNIFLPSFTRQALLNDNVNLAEDYFEELLYEKTN